MKVSELRMNGYTATLVAHDNGERALWICDEYLAGRSDVEGRFTLNDNSERVPIDANEDVDKAISEWKEAVGWDI